VPLPQSTQRWPSRALFRLDTEDQVVNDLTHSDLVKELLAERRAQADAEDAA
jgi:hypothetical protein